MRHLSIHFLALALAAALPAADKIAIRPHWESGKIYTMENVMTSTTSVPGLGEQGKQSTSMTQTITVSVIPEAGTGNRLAQMKIAGIKAVMSMMGQVMNYDSADSAKSPPMLQQAFGAVVGREFTMVYDKDDKVADVRGMESLMATPLGGAKGPDGKQFVDAFRKSQEMGFPKDPVAPGDVWTFNDTMAMPPLGSLQIKGSGKFEDIVEAEGRRHARITYEGTFSTPDAAAGGAAPMVKFGEGSTMKGEVLFDLERRLASSSNVNTELKMSTAGQEIPVSQKVTTKIIKIEAAR